MSRVIFRFASDSQLDSAFFHSPSFNLTESHPGQDHFIRHLTPPQSFMSLPLSYFTPTGALSRAGNKQFRCRLEPCSSRTDRFGLLTKHPRTSQNFVKHLCNEHNFANDAKGMMVPPEEDEALGKTENRARPNNALVPAERMDTTKVQEEDEDSDEEEDDEQDEEEKQDEKQQECDEVADSDEDSSQTRSTAHALRRRSVRNSTPSDCCSPPLFPRPHNQQRKPSENCTWFGQRICASATSV